jgi:Zn-dependent protease
MFGVGARMKIARIGGIPIYVSYSWFLIAALFGFSLHAGLVSEGHTEQALRLTALMLALFFGGILLHEGAHAVAARGFGLPVRAITLVFWGGATETRSWRAGPVADFVVAASGPATTAVLWLVFSFLRDNSVPGTSMHFVWTYLAWVNGVMALLNLLPGFPLDGGRMLMAIAWGVTRRRALAMRVAGIGSMLVGGLLIAWAVLRFANGDGSGIFAGYIGFVMIGVGRQIPSRAALRERLERGTARDAMRPIDDAIPADTTVYDATERWLRARPKYAFPVWQDGRLVGTVSWDEASRATAATRVANVMVPLDDAPVVDADEPLDETVDWLGGRDGLVVDAAGRTVGLLALEDVDRWLKAHWATGRSAEPSAAVVPPRPDQ